VASTEVGTPATTPESDAAPVTTPDPGQRPTGPGKRGLADGGTATASDNDGGSRSTGLRPAPPGRATPPTGPARNQWHPAWGVGPPSPQHRPVNRRAPPIHPIPVPFAVAMPSAG